MGRKIKKYKIKTYEEENDKLIISYLSRLLSGKHSESDENLNIEIFIENKNSHKKINQKYEYLNNLEFFFNWLIKNIHCSYQLNIWNEESSYKNQNFNYLELIFRKLKKSKNKPTSIFIFSNFSLLSSRIYRNKLEKIIEHTKTTNIPISFLFTDEGINSPFLKHLKNNDNYCKNIFYFIKTYNLKYLGILSPETIRNWKEKFLLFQKNFKKYNILPSQFFLTEKKEAIWSEKDTKKFVDFINFLINWSFYNLCNKEINKFLDFLFKKKGYDILYNPLKEKPRSIGCYVGNNLCVRIKDLSIIPCHKILVKPFILGKFQIKNNKILRIEPNNLELLIGLCCLDKKNFPLCETCLLKYLCSSVCLSSQFKKTGDLFSPDPTICRLEHGKIASMIKNYKKLRIYNKIYSKLNKDKKDSLDILSELMF